MYLFLKIIWDISMFFFINKCLFILFICKYPWTYVSEYMTTKPHELHNHTIALIQKHLEFMATIWQHLDICEDYIVHFNGILSKQVLINLLVCK